MDQSDERFMRTAIELAQKSRSEDERIHPKVGVVVVSNGKILATAYRGEFDQGDHAEYIALEKKLVEVDLTGATIYTTLEPCIARNHPKVPCAQRVLDRRIARVVIGMLDPNPEIRGRGVFQLKHGKASVDLINNQQLERELEDMNRDFIDACEQAPRRTMPVKPFDLAGIDSIFLQRRMPYRRVFISPDPSGVELIAPSSENDAWLDGNVPPVLLFDDPHPQQNGVIFGSHEEQSYAEISRSGEIYYCEIVPPEDGVNLARNVVSVHGAFQYARKVYERFSYEGVVTIDFRLGNMHGQTLTGDKEVQIFLFRKRRYTTEQPEITVKKKIATTDLANDAQIESIIIESSRGFGLALNAGDVKQLIAHNRI
jgi:pyrimidine deaminase RibD-like protein